MNGGGRRSNISAAKRNSLDRNANGRGRNDLGRIRVPKPDYCVLAALSGRLLRHHPVSNTGTTAFVTEYGRVAGRVFSSPMVLPAYNTPAQQSKRYGCIHSTQAGPPLDAFRLAMTSFALPPGSCSTLTLRTRRTVTPPPCSGRCGLFLARGGKMDRPNPSITVTNTGTTSGNVDNDWESLTQRRFHFWLTCRRFHR